MRYSVPMMEWYIVDYPEVGHFDSEESAIARAWELTPPGAARSEVTYTASDGALSASAGTHSQGGTIDLKAVHVFHKGAGYDPRAAQMSCIADLQAQAAAHGAWFGHAPTFSLTEEFSCLRVTATVQAERITLVTPDFLG